MPIQPKKHSRARRKTEDSGLEFRRKVRLAVKSPCCDSFWWAEYSNGSFSCGECYGQDHPKTESAHKALQQTPNHTFTGPQFPSEKLYKDFSDETFDFTKGS